VFPTDVPSIKVSNTERPLQREGSVKDAEQEAPQTNVKKRLLAMKPQILDFLILSFLLK